MDEMMEDAMSALDDDDIEDAVDSEVDKVLFELTAGQLGQMPDAQTDKLPQGTDLSPLFEMTAQIFVNSVFSLQLQSDAKIKDPFLC